MCVSLVVASTDKGFVENATKRAIVRVVSSVAMGIASERPVRSVVTTTNAPAGIAQTEIAVPSAVPASARTA